MESNSFNSGADGESSPCREFLNLLMVLDEMDLRDISEKDLQWKVRKINEIQTSQARFEETCAFRYEREYMRSLLSKFQFALLKLAYSAKLSGEDHDPGSPIVDFISRYSEEEFNGISKLEQFSGLDALNPANVREALDRKEGKIYEIIRKWYNSQMYEFNLLIDAAPESRMRNTIKKALIDRYNSRFETLREGVVQYMSHDAVAPAKLFNQYDDVASRFYEAQNGWKEITGSFNSMPIHEIENRYYEVETEESDIKEKISRLQDSLKEVSDFHEPLNRIKELEANLLEMHKTFHVEVEGKIAEVSVLIDRGNSLIHQIEMRSTTETDPKALAIFRSQADYLRQRLEEILVSRKRLEEIENETRRHVLITEERLERASDVNSAEEAGSLVRIDEAVADGISFIYRFRRKMEEALPFTLKDLNEDGNIKIVSKYALETALKVKQSPDEDRNFMQANLYHFRKNRIIGDPMEVSVGFVFYTHRNLFQRDLLDSRPVSLSEFLEIFESIKGELGSSNKTAYIGIYSPTGFEERVLSRVVGDNRIFLDNIFLFLIDRKLSDARPNRKVEDELISKLFNLELGQEREDRARKAIRDYIARTDDVSLERISKEAGISIDLLEYIADGMKRNKEIEVKRISKMKVVSRRLN